MNSIFENLRYCVRTLILRPGFTTLCVLSLAVGIGASTAMFSVLNGVLLRPLPYTNVERLAVVCSDMRVRNVKNFPFSPPDFDDLRKGTTGAFEDMAALWTFRQAVSVPGSEPEVVAAAGVTPNFFHLMGAHITHGRDFEEKDATPPPGNPQPGIAPAATAVPVVAILSENYWQRRYGGDRSVIGRSIDFGGGRAQVVGILSPLPLLFAPDRQILRDPAIWIAGRIDYKNSARNDVFLTPVGLLRRGTNFQTAEAQVANVAAELRRRFVVHRTAGQYFRVEPLHKDLVRDVRPVLLAIMGAVAFLFLIACANVANLLLVRGMARGREFAVRAALGGTRFHLVQQVLTESLLLAAAGAVAGSAIAWCGMKLLTAAGPEDLPRIDSIGVDFSVLAFTIVSALLAALIFGMFPALRASRIDLIDSLRASGRTSGLAAASLARKGVIITEVALSFVLLVGSGLMVRSLIALQGNDPGFDPHNVLTFVISNYRGTPDQIAALIKTARERLGTLPGVLGVTASSSLPLDGTAGPVRWGTAEAAGNPALFHAANLQIVLPGYFQTLRTRLIAGRPYTEDDNRLDRKLIIIDELLARKAFPHQSAVGNRILARFRTPEAEWLQIIGVVAHQRDTSLAREGREELFIPDGYLGFGAVNRWALRTVDNPLHLASAVRTQIAQIDSKLLVTEVQSMDTFVNRSQAETRFALTTMGVFAIVAVVLAMIGLYGVLAATVQQRTAEIGLRMALGARPGNILQLMLGQGLRLSAIGLIAGVVAALAMTQLMASLLVEIKPTDPLTFVSMALLFFLVTLLASWLPAWRASRLAPMVALRQE